MKKLKRKILAFLLTFAIISQALIVYADTTLIGGVPSEVANADHFKEIPIYYKGERVEVFQEYLRKYNDTAVNENEKFDIKGTATFKVKAYAYQTGNEVKLGTYIQCLGEDGNWFEMNWRDREDQVSTSALQGYIKGSQSVSITIDNIAFAYPNSNKSDLRLIFKMQASTGGSFQRETAKGVSFNAGSDVESATTIAYKLYSNKEEKTSGTTVTPVDGKMLHTDMNNITVKRGSAMVLDITSNNISKQEYAIVEGEQLPSLPLNGTAWTDMGAIISKNSGWETSYPDLVLEKKGYISTTHYNYKYGSKTKPESDVPARRDTFSYPIGETLVYQQATKDSANQYHSTENASAFFGKSATGDTNFTAEFMAPINGTYQFAVFSNAGAEGSITVGGKTLSIVNDFNTAKTSATASYHTNSNVSCELEAGKEYAMKMKWTQTDSNSVVPSLYYRVKANKTYSDWTLVPAGNINDEAYTGGANKAVKFWGYIVPNETAEYNFAAYSDDGAYGYLIVDGEKKKFVENWDIASAYDRYDQGVNITLEKDTPYPIYMEWYEGNPTEKCFYPRYKKVNEATFKNIPSDWFYPSSNETPGVVADAYFEPAQATSLIPLGTNLGKKHVVVRLTDTTGKINYVTYDNIIVEASDATIDSSDLKNKIVPESLSNIYWKMEYPEFSKDITYTLNIGNINGNKYESGNDLMKLDVESAFVNIKDNTGSVVSSDYYTVVPDATNNSISITFDSSYVAEAGTTHDIVVYFKTKMGNDVRYGKYLESFNNTKQSANVKGKYKERYYITTLVDGTVTFIEEYNDNQKEEEIFATYAEIPSVS